MCTDARANASGKSNVISAIAFLTHAVTASHRVWLPEGGVGRDPCAWGGERADVGIIDIRLEGERPSSPFDLRKGAEIFLRHRSRTGEAWLPLREESAGTRTLLHLTASYLATLHRGGVLVVDELEAGLHPLLGLYLVDQFNDPVKNPRNAQLIFTTHDTNLLGTSLGAPALRRDHVWLTEKDDDGATKLYPLTDYAPRKAENLETGYLQGR